TLRGPARKWWDEHLGLEPGRDDERRLAELGREHAALDEDRVRIEGQPLMTGADLLDDAADADRPDAGDLRLEDDRVVELEVRPLPHPDPELERRRVLGAEDEPARLRDRRRDVEGGRRLGGGRRVDRWGQRPFADHATA